MSAKNMDRARSFQKIGNQMLEKNKDNDNFPNLQDLESQNLLLFAESKNF
jgi:hypothetical protein